MTAAEKALDDDERRALRDSWRASGGSARRPLHSFRTTADKRALRDAHAAHVRAAVDQLADATGFERWLESLVLNARLSPMNSALVALQTPGEVVDTAAGWKRRGYRVRKGERCAGRITAPGFWPLPYFTAAQAGAVELADVDPALPPRGRAEGLRASLAAALAEGLKPRLALEAVAAEARKEIAGWEVRPVHEVTSSADPESLF